MTDRAEADSTESDGYYKIADASALPVGWEAHEIALGRISYHIDVQGRLNFRFSDVSYYKCDATYGIDAFLSDLEKQSLPPRERGMSSVAPVSAMQLPVGRTCYVVLTFEDGMRARFSTTGPALTTKQDYGSDNLDLVQHAPTICHFKVAQRKPYQHQHFNFHIELEQDGNRPWLGLTLDPDVPDDGGGVPLTAPPAS